LRTDQWTCCSVVVGLCKIDLMTACNYRTTRVTPARVTVTCAGVAHSPQHIHGAVEQLEGYEENAYTETYAFKGSSERGQESYGKRLSAKTSRGSYLA